MSFNFISERNAKQYQLHSESIRNKGWVLIEPAVVVDPQIEAVQDSIQ